jgi:hypothetical protein
MNSLAVRTSFEKRSLQHCCRDFYLSDTTQDQSVVKMRLTDVEIRMLQKLTGLQGSRSAEINWYEDHI